MAKVGSRFARTIVSMPQRVRLWQPFVWQWFSRARPQIIVIVSVFCFIGLLVGSVSVISLLTAAEPESDGYLPDPARFALYDAELICAARLELQIGEDLLRYHVDSHSSRLDTAKGVFRVYMQADIGEMAIYEEVAVHCFVDQWDTRLSHFRKYHPSMRGLVSAKLKFF